MLHPFMIRTVATTLALALCGAGAAAEPTLDPGTLGFTEPAHPPTGFEAHLHGIAQPGRKVGVASTLEGTLMTLLVREGQVVEAGEPLAVLDNRTARASVRVAEVEADRTADMERAEVAVELARSRYERTRKSSASGGSTDFEIEEALAALKQAEADLKRAREARQSALQRLELEKTRLEQHTIRAPFDGTITRIKAEEGQSITREKEILTLVQLSTLRADVHLPVEAYGKVIEGQTYRLRASAPVSRLIDGRLINVEPVVDPATRTFRCVFEIDNSSESLPAGFLVQVDEQSVLAVLSAHPTGPAG